MERLPICGRAKERRSMGVLADIYVSSAERAAEYDANPESFRDEAACWKRFTVLELSTLWTALQEREWEVELIDRFDTVMVKGGGERMIMRLPDELLHDVLAADDARRDRALAKWAASEELACEVDDVRPFWDDLKRIADVAVTSGRGVFLWNCV